MRDLNYALKQICHRNRDGAFGTQADRERILDLIADQLHEMGFRHMDAGSLKPKHVETLVARWLAEQLSPGTIKNRMSALRWWAEKIGKQNIVARTNAAYGIPDRVYVTNTSKAKAIDSAKLAEIRDVYVQMSLRLQAAFGLRREESIKIVLALADRGDVLHLKASWCKGGRERDIPITTLEQRHLVDEAKALAKARASSRRATRPTPRISSTSATSATASASTASTGTATSTPRRATRSSPAGPAPRAAVRRESSSRPSSASVIARCVSSSAMRWGTVARKSSRFTADGRSCPRSLTASRHNDGRKPARRSAV